MAPWKRLTEVGGKTIDVNMDWVAYIQRISDSTTEIVFAAGTGKKDTVQVTESLLDIHQGHPIVSR
jgi:S1-C subfamily serine protease